MRHFGYALFDERGEPFYIGIGSRKSRPTDHVRAARNGKRGRRYSKIRRMLQNNFDIPIVVFRDGMTLAEAKEMEVALVSVVKRWPNGPLTNINAGGNSPHDVHYRSGKKVPDDTRKKISVTLTGRKLGPYSGERVERLRKGLIGRKLPPFTEEHLGKLAEATRRSWDDPAVRASRTGMKGRKHKPETIEKMRSSAKARTTPELVERMRELGRSGAGKRRPAKNRVYILDVADD